MAPTPETSRPAVVTYCPHPSDSRASSADTQNRRISRQEVALVCLAGAIWELYNGAFTITFSFSPILLVEGGMAVGAAGFLVGSATWLVVASVQAGGIIAQRWGRPNTLMLAGVIIWGIGLALLPSAHPVAVPTVLGLFMGLPVGVIIALPAEVLHLASRAIGTGVFYTGLYIGHAGLPPIAGWLQDLSGDAAVSLYFAGVLVVLILPLFAAFRLRQGRSAPGALARPG